MSMAFKRSVRVDKIMANRRAFKSDVSFLEKISLGAVGTQRVFEHLRNQGHNPLELERGSMSLSSISPSVISVLPRETISLFS
jgi:hypothetical protein